MADKRYLVLYISIYSQMNDYLQNFALNIYIFDLYSHDF